MGRLPVVLGNDFKGVCDCKCGRFGLECIVDAGRGRFLWCGGWWCTAWYLQCPPEGGKGLGCIYLEMVPHTTRTMFSQVQTVSIFFG